MPATIELSDESLVVQIERGDRLWALKSRLEIPLAHVVDVKPAAEEAHRWLHGLKVGGSHIPGVISVGRFYSHGQWVFWDVHDAEKAIEVALQDDRYDRLVIEVRDPAGEIARVRAAIGAVVA
ncbi:MAG: hypothetical protein QOF77_1215 [Solirubrobacteraceae bacterium]|jgi:hypothetical protein|nr:hypothetical protein [Solirubrobacteraceae bacterium]